MQKERRRLPATSFARRRKAGVGSRVMTGAAPDPQQIIMDVLWLLSATGAVEIPTVQPQEVTFSTAAGWLGLSAGPAYLLLPAKHPEDLVVGCCFGDAAELVFLVVAACDGSLTVLRNEPDPWSDELIQRAQQFRDALTCPPIGIYAPSSMLLH
jgi:hypothetical protein